MDTPPLLSDDASVIYTELLDRIDALIAHPRHARVAVDDTPAQDINMQELRPIFRTLRDYFDPDLQEDASPEEAEQKRAAFIEQFKQLNPHQQMLTSNFFQDILYLDNISDSMARANFLDPVGEDLEADDPRVRGTMRHFIHEMQEGGATYDQVLETLEPVFNEVITGHPTNVNALERIEAIKTLRESHRTYREAAGEGASEPHLTALSDRVTEALDAFIGVQAVPDKPLSTREETQWGLYFLRNRFEMVDTFYEEIDQALEACYGDAHDPRRVDAGMRHSSWVTGNADKDGNANVFWPDTMYGVREHARTAKTMYQNELDALRDVAGANADDALTAALDAIQEGINQAAPDALEYGPTERTVYQRKVNETFDMILGPDADGQGPAATALAAFLGETREDIDQIASDILEGRRVRFVDAETMYDGLNRILEEQPEKIGEHVWKAALQFRRKLDSFGASFGQMEYREGKPVLMDVTTQFFEGLTDEEFHEAVGDTSITKDETLNWWLRDAPAVRTNEDNHTIEFHPGCRSIVDSLTEAEYNRITNHSVLSFREATNWEWGHDHPKAITNREKIFDALKLEEAKHAFNSLTREEIMDWRIQEIPAVSFNGSTFEFHPQCRKLIDSLTEEAYKELTGETVLSFREATNWEWGHDHPRAMRVREKLFDALGLEEAKQAFDQEAVAARTRLFKAAINNEIEGFDITDTYNLLWTHATLLDEALGEKDKHLFLTTMGRMEIALLNPELVENHVVAETETPDNVFALEFLKHATQEKLRAQQRDEGVYEDLTISSASLRTTPLYEDPDSLQDGAIKERIQPFLEDTDYRYALAQQAVYRRLPEQWETFCDQWFDKPNLTEAEKAGAVLFTEKALKQQGLDGLFQEVKLAHSDTGRQSGIPASRAFLYFAHQDINDVFQETGIDGIISEGGSQTAPNRGGMWAMSAFVRLNELPYLKATIQGHDNNIYGNNLYDYIRHLTTLKAACARNVARHQETGPYANGWRNRVEGEEIAGQPAKDFYREFQKEVDPLYKQAANAAFDQYRDAFYENPVTGRYLAALCGYEEIKEWSNISSRAGDKPKLVVDVPQSRDAVEAFAEAHREKMLKESTLDLASHIDQLRESVDSADAESLAGNFAQLIDYLENEAGLSIDLTQAPALPSIHPAERDMSMADTRAISYTKTLTHIKNFFAHLTFPAIMEHMTDALWERAGGDGGDALSQVMRGIRKEAEAHHPGDADAQRQAFDARAANILYRKAPAMREIIDRAGIFGCLSDFDYQRERMHTRHEEMTKSEHKQVYASGHGDNWQAPTGDMLEKDAANYQEGISGHLSWQELEKHKAAPYVLGALTGEPAALDAQTTSGDIRAQVLEKVPHMKRYIQKIDLALPLTQAINAVVENTPPQDLSVLQTLFIERGAFNAGDFSIYSPGKQVSDPGYGRALAVHTDPHALDAYITSDDVRHYATMGGMNGHVRA